MFFILCNIMTFSSKISKQCVQMPCILLVGEIDDELMKTSVIAENDKLSKIFILLKSLNGLDKHICMNYDFVMNSMANNRCSFTCNLFTIPHDIQCRVMQRVTLHCSNMHYIL